MKIKHWAGYGTVDVTRTGKRSYHNCSGDETVMVFRIVGDHECGLKPCYHDDRLIQNWLRRWTRGYIVTDYWTEDIQNWCSYEHATKLIVIMKEEPK